ncbi:MAG: hypothetical protein K2M70_11945 [Lachnospiraceae bacterium]|nr:hypothetical protein [Lachnospiraceae bacterium]
MVKVIIAFTIADLVLSLIYAKIPLFTRVWHFKRWERWEQKTYFQRFSESFFSVLIGFLICLAINYYHEVNNPTGFEQMLIDGDAEYLVVFGDEYVGDADVALEIKQGHSPDKICKIISSICKEDYIQKGSDTLKVYVEGDEYVIMDGDKKIGKVTTFDRKFGVVLRFYWNLSSTENIA